MSARDVGADDEGARVFAAVLLDDRLDAGLLASKIVMAPVEHLAFVKRDRRWLAGSCPATWRSRRQGYLSAERSPQADVFFTSPFESAPRLSPSQEADVFPDLIIEAV